MRDIKECIVYEDDDICVCHKPSGVLTQSDRGFSQDMVSALMTYERKKGNRAPFIAPVNRLDRPVVCEEQQVGGGTHQTDNAG